MKKNIPLWSAIIGAAILALQQFVGKPGTNVKVILFAVLIAVVGAASTVLKGRGASLVGILGTVGYTFFQIWNNGTFTWTEFLVSGLIAVLTLVAPTLIPQQADPEEKP